MLLLKRKKTRSNICAGFGVGTQTPRHANKMPKLDVRFSSILIRITDLKWLNQSKKYQNCLRHSLTARHDVIPYYAPLICMCRNFENFDEHSAWKQKVNYSKYTVEVYSLKFSQMRYITVVSHSC